MFKKIGSTVFALAPLSAFAAVDTAPIDAAKADVTAVGVAVFAVMVGIAVYRWIRRAL